MHKEEINKVATNQSTTTKEALEPWWTEFIERWNAKYPTTPLYDTESAKFYVRRAVKFILTNSIDGNEPTVWPSRVTAPIVAPEVDHGVVLVDREAAAKMAFDAVKGALTNENNYSTLQVAAIVAANVRRVPAPAATVAPVEQSDANRSNNDDALNWVGNKLRPEHKCKPLARAVMMQGRDWWIGELTEHIPEWPLETHCLHMKTPLKDVSFLCNSGDFEQLLVLSNVVVKLKNLVWLRAATARAKAFILPPFSSCGSCHHNNVDEHGVCQESVEFLFRCLHRCVPTAAVPASPVALRDEAEDFARRVVGTVFDNTAASPETLKQTMIERIADFVTPPSTRAEAAAEEIDKLLVPLREYAKTPGINQITAIIERCLAGGSKNKIDE